MPYRKVFSALRRRATPIPPSHTSSSSSSSKDVPNFARSIITKSPIRKSKSKRTALPASLPPPLPLSLPVSTHSSQHPALDLERTVIRNELSGWSPPASHEIPEACRQNVVEREDNRDLRAEIDEFHYKNPCFHLLYSNTTPHQHLSDRCHHMSTIFEESGDLPMSPPGLLTPLSFPHTQSGISVEVNVVDGSASDSESEPTTPPPEVPKEGRGAGCVMKKRGGMTSLSSICEEEDEETDADTVTEKDETTDDTASEGSFEGDWKDVFTHSRATSTSSSTSPSRTSHVSRSRYRTTSPDRDHDQSQLNSVRSLLIAATDEIRALKATLSTKEASHLIELGSLKNDKRKVEHELKISRREVRAMKTEQERMNEYARKMAGEIGRLQEQLAKRDAALRVRGIAIPGSEAEDDSPPRHKVRRKRVPSVGADAGLPSPPPSASSCSESDRRSSLDSPSRPSFSSQNTDDPSSWRLISQIDEDDEDQLFGLPSPPSPLLTPTTPTPVSPPLSPRSCAQDQDHNSIFDEHDFGHDPDDITSMMAMRDGRSSRLGYRDEALP